MEYLKKAGLAESYEAMKKETHSDCDDLKVEGLLEKKWTSVIRLQKKVVTSLRPLGRLLLTHHQICRSWSWNQRCNSWSRR